MALSERLQMKKIQEASGNDEQEFALVLFEDEDKYSVVETSRIQEKYYVVNQTVHVLWGMGKSVTPFRAKLILCGTKEDCDKEALNLSFSSSPSHLRLKDDYDSNSEPEIQEKTMLKRKGKDHVRVPVKKNKESNKSASASWQANLEEEQQKLKHAVNLNSQQELLRSFTGSVKRDSSPLQHDLSSIITRLDSIEEKVDALLKMPWSQPTRNPAPQTFATPTPPASRSGSPLMPKERNDTRLASHSVSDEEALETSEMVFNGIDLLTLKAPPREPTRYATRLAGVLFTKEELTMGMIPPLNEKYNRQPLDPSRVSMMRNCISQKYSGKVATKCWADIRRAVNQKCNDIRKKNVSGSAEHLQDENN